MLVGEEMIHLARVAKCQDIDRLILKSKMTERLIDDFNSIRSYAYYIKQI